MLERKERIETEIKIFERKGKYENERKEEEE